MATLTGQSIHAVSTEKRKSLVSRFFKWTEAQEQHRFLWLAIGIVGHGCFLTIVTLMAIAFAGNNFIYWPFAIGAMSMTVISNLAALPTKYTIPIFFFSILIDLVIIALCIGHGMNAGAVFTS